MITSDAATRPKKWWVVRKEGTRKRVNRWTGEREKREEKKS